MAIEEKNLSDKIKLFNALNNFQEAENKGISNFIHGDILIQAIFLKNNLSNQLEDVKNNKIDLTSFKRNINLVEKLYKDLRLIMQTLYPSVLETFGLIKAIEGYVRDIKESSFKVDIKKDITAEDIKLSFEQELNIFRTFVLVLNYFERISQQKQLSIFINRLDKNLYIEFVSGNADRENIKNENSITEIHAIEARLLLIKAKIGQNTDWLNFVQIIIPIEN